MSKTVEAVPSIRQPWYQSTLLWGAFSLAATIVFTVVAAMTKDIRWALFGAWPFAAIAVWEFLSYFVESKKRRVTATGLISVVLVIGLIVLYVRLKPPETKAASASSAIRLSKGPSTPQTLPISNPADATTPSVAPTLAQADQIVRTIVDRYQKEHNGHNPTIKWINHRLKDQGQPFHIGAKSPRPPAARSKIAFFGGNMKDNWDVVHNENPNVDIEMTGVNADHNKHVVYNVLPPSRPQ